MAKKPKKSVRSAKKLGLKTPTGVYRIFNLGVAIAILVILVKSTQTDGDKTIWFYLSVASLPVTALVGFVLSFLLGSHKEDPSLRSGVMRLWALSNNGIISVVLVVIMVFSYVVPYQRKIEQASPCYGVRESDQADLDEREVLVLFANFKGLNNATDKPDEQWMSVLPYHLKDAIEDQNIRFLDVKKTIEKPSEAFALSNCYDATLIVWGEVMGAGVKVNHSTSQRWELERLDSALELEQTFLIDESRNAITMFIDQGGDEEYIINSLIGQLLFFDGNYVEAEKYLTSAIDFAYANFSTRLVEMGTDRLLSILALNFDSLGNQKQAYEFANEAVMLNTDSDYAWLTLGHIYFWNGEYHSALTAYSNSDDPLSYLNQGAILAYQGETDLAVNFVSRAINGLETSDNSDNVLLSQAYYTRGNILQTQGLVESAIADFTAATRLNNQNALAFYHRGYVHLEIAESGQSSRYQFAIDDFSTAIKLAPNYVDAYIDRGYVYSVLGDNTKALQDLNQAVSLDPNSGRAYLQRGIIYQFLNQIDNAKADFAIAEKLGWDVIYR